jgi:hypothetical protein
LIPLVTAGRSLYLGHCARPSLAGVQRGYGLKPYQDIGDAANGKEAKTLHSLQ